MEYTDLLELVTKLKAIQEDKPKVIKYRLTTVTNEILGEVVGDLWKALQSGPLILESKEDPYKVMDMLHKISPELPSTVVVESEWREAEVVGITDKSLFAHTIIDV